MIWGVLLLSAFAFLFVLYLTVPKVFKFNSSTPIADENFLIILIFAIVALSNFGMSFVLRKYFVERAIREQDAAGVQSAVIISCALCEAIALFGFMLALVAEYQYFFVWFALGLVGILINIPRKSELVAASGGR